MTVRAEKLLRMAEQITANMSYTDDRAAVAAKVLDHLNRFWDPRMKAALLDHAQSRPDDLSPPLHDAVAALRQSAAEG